MTQNAAILSYLKAGQPITPYVALYKFGVFRLAARVKELRDQGWRIKTLPHVTHKGAKVAKYLLVSHKRGH